jgi:hypothetical protein
MKSTWVMRWGRKLALTALALCSFAAPGKAADNYTGRFTLPHQVRWGSVVLPAGEYTFRMQSPAAPYVIYLRGEGITAIIMTISVDTKVPSGQSRLDLIQTGSEYTVRALEAPALGVTFLYGERPTKSGSQEHMTEAKEPGLNVSVSPDEDMRPERFGP